jgi:hypothetical protein
LPRRKNPLTESNWIELRKKLYSEVKWYDLYHEWTAEELTGPHFKTVLKRLGAMGIQVRK